MHVVNFYYSLCGIIDEKFSFCDLCETAVNKVFTDGGIFGIVFIIRQDNPFRIHNVGSADFSVIADVSSQGEMIQIFIYGFESR